MTKNRTLVDLLHPDVAAAVRALALPAMNDDLLRTIRAIDPPPVELSDDVVRSDHVVPDAPPVPVRVHRARGVDALLYLESAPMVNGENIRIDGGAHAGAKW